MAISACAPRSRRARGHVGARATRLRRLRSALRALPIGRHRAEVVDDLAVGGPAEFDGLGRVDAARARVAAGAKPVLLRRPGGPGADACVRGSRDGVTEHVLEKSDVVRDHTGGEMVLHGVENLEHQGQLALLPINNDLERPEQLRNGDLEALRVLQRFDRDPHCSRLDGTIDLGDGVAGQGLATEGQLRSRNLKASLHMGHEALGAPRHDRADGQVLQAPLGRGLGQLLDNALLVPVLVNEEHGLCRTLLAAESISVLVRLPGHVFHVHGVRPQDLPIETSVLQLHLALEVGAELLRDVLGAGEKRHAGVAVHEDLVHDRPAGIDQIHVGLRQPDMVHHPQELLDAELYLLVDLRGDLVAHEHS
mmetsp:Transcript_84824/g.274153  ORF Transcript_84824/g.274153 Transcript_84824/m.274153 type:complete len:365 (-) Transcript_84824:751-1845(-)